MTDPHRVQGDDRGTWAGAATESQHRRPATAWIIAALVVALVATVGIIGAMWLLGRGSNGPAPSAVDDFTVAASTETGPGDGGGQRSSTQSSDSPAPPQDNATTPSSSSVAPTRNSATDSAFVPGELNPRGWTNRVTCNASDDWVYAASNGSDYALICVATPGGGLYYKGLFRGGEAEHDIAAQSGVGTTNARFDTLASGDTHITIDGSELYVYGSGGAIIAQTTFGQVYAQ